LLAFFIAVINFISTITSSAITVTYVNDNERKIFN